MKFPDGDSLCRYVREHTDKVLLRFSTGKDSICSWLKLRHYFTPEEILPVHQAFVPSKTGKGPLCFVEQNLDYFENVFETRIIRVIHPHFYAMLRSGVFQTPEQIKIIESTDFPLYDNESIFNNLKSELGLSPNTYIAAGFKAVDKPERNDNIKEFGPLNEKTGTFFPIYDWTDEQVVRCLQESKIKLPIDYMLFSSSFTTSLREGINPTMLEKLYRHFPQDYETIKFWFPLCDSQLYRHRAKTRNAGCLPKSQMDRISNIRYNSIYLTAIENFENKVAYEIQPLIKKLEMNLNKYSEEFIPNQSWVCIVFQDSVTREQFLLKTGLGDKNTQYIEGNTLAMKMNLSLDMSPIPPPSHCDSLEELSHLAL